MKQVIVVGEMPGCGCSGGSCWWYEGEGLRGVVLLRDLYISARENLKSANYTNIEDRCE